MYITCVKCSCSELKLIKYLHTFFVLTKKTKKNPVLGSIWLLVGNPNRKKMHIFGFVGIFEYIC